MNLSQQEVIEKIKNKDHTVITFLYQSYNKSLVLGAIKRGMAIDQAETIAQNTWCDFYENAHKFEGRSHIRTYLFGIMKNKVHETFRSNLKYTKHDIAEAQELSFEPEEQAINKDLLIALTPDLKELPQIQQDILIKKEALGYSPKELSIEYDLTPNHIAIIAYRAKNSLKANLYQYAS